MKVNKMASKNWTEQELNKVRELWADHASTKEISEALGRSRNSVIGAAHRLGLPMHKNSFQRGRRTAKKTTPKIRYRYVRTVPLPLPAPAPLLTAIEPVPFMELREHHCRAVIGSSHDLHGLALFCGLPKVDGTSWCAYHADLYFRRDGDVRSS